MEKRVHIASEDKDTNMVQQLISKYLPYWPLFILFALIALALAYAYLRYATPLYQASATVIIKDDTRGGGEDKFAQSLNLKEEKKSKATELRKIKRRKEHAA